MLPRNWRHRSTIRNPICTTATPHYLVITGGTTGDIHPFMRIASALQGLGHARPTATGV
jgi:hypothetical protein